MSARPIGEIIAGIMERCERMQLLHLLLRATPCPATKKSIIMNMRKAGLTDDETAMLIECYELEEA